MYVRWKKRPEFKDGRPTGGCTTMTAVLVESVRSPHPRQRIVATLAGISTKKWGSSAYERNRFWQTVDSRLDALNLPPEVRRDIECKLRQVVTRPTAEEQEEEAARGRAGLSEAESHIAGHKPMGVRSANQCMLSGTSGGTTAASSMTKALTLAELAGWPPLRLIPLFVDNGNKVVVEGQRRWTCYLRFAEPNRFKAARIALLEYLREHETATDGDG